MKKYLLLVPVAIVGLLIAGDAEKITAIDDAGVATKICQVGNSNVNQQIQCSSVVVMAGKSGKTMAQLGTNGAVIGTFFVIGSDVGKSFTMTNIVGTVTNYIVFGGGVVTNVHQ